MSEKQFRFQDLEIWNRGAAVSGLFKLAVGLENRRLFLFAEQLRGAILSISNNINGISISGASSNTVGGIRAKSRSSLSAKGTPTNRLARKTLRCEI